MKKKLEVLYEDKYMIAVVKPPGVPSQSDRSNDEDIVSGVKNYLFDNSDSDTEPYAAIINRLDKPVGGIVLLAGDQSKGEGRHQEDRFLHHVAANFCKVREKA